MLATKEGSKLARNTLQNKLQQNKESKQIVRMHVNMKAWKQMSKLLPNKKTTKLVRNLYE